MSISSDSIDSIRPKYKKFYGIKKPIPLTRRRRDFKFIKHECCSECSTLEKRLIEDNPNKFIVTADAILMNEQSPYLVPLFLEFKRKNDEDDDCGYLSPCGVELYSYPDIYSYLKVSESRLNINQFILTARIELFRFHSYFKVYALRRDITNKLEPTPIQAINEFKPIFYEDFNYIKECELSSDLRKSSVEDVDGSHSCSCNCEDDCSDIDKCQCRQRSIQENKTLNPNNRAGYEYNYLINPPKTAIYECNSNCKCKRRTCLNRVVQNGIKIRLQVYKTSNRGFGLRPLHDVPRGAFICGYEGLIVKNGRSHDEENNAYLMNLSYKYCYSKLQKDIESGIYELIEPSNQLEHQKVIKTDNKESNSCKRSKESIGDFVSIHDLTQTSDLDLSDSDSTFSDLTITDYSDLSLTSESEHQSLHNKDHPIGLTAKQFDDHTQNLSEPEEMNGCEEPRKKKLKKEEPDQQLDSDYLIDAQTHANVSRFMNHSCNPNLICQPVFIESNTFEHYGIFAIKDIKAYSELTFDYFFGGHPESFYFDCKCKSRKCRFKSNNRSRSKKYKI